MTWTIYHDVFGGWRWECHNATTTIDSQHSYDTRQECAEAVRKARSVLVGSGTAMSDQSQKAQLPTRSASVLCVQPKQDLHASLTAALRDCEVMVVANAFEALRRFNVSAFDAYVLEYWVPDWSGAQLCREIRRTDPHVPICFYVLTGAEEHRKRAIRAGASSYMCVSDDASMLRQTLNTLLDAAKARNIQAMAVEERVIVAELKRRFVIPAPQAPRANASSAGITERAVKIKARKAFIDAGGTAGHFERSWGALFATAIARFEK